MKVLYNGVHCSVAHTWQQLRVWKFCWHLVHRLFGFSHRAIAESLQSGVISPGSQDNPETGPTTTTTQPMPRDTSVDDDLRLALEMSQRELEDAEKRRREEEDELNRIIQLSLTDK